MFPEMGQLCHSGKVTGENKKHKNNTNDTIEFDYRFGSGKFKPTDSNQKTSFFCEKISKLLDQNTI